MELYVALLLVVFTGVLYLLKKTYYFWQDRGVIQFPITIPYGNAKGLGKNFHLSEFIVDYYQRTKKSGARFSGIYMITRPILLITDLDLVKSILVKDFNVFPNRGLYHNERDDPLSGNLFNLENDPWRNLRQKISPVFTSGKLKMMFGTINEVADKLLAVIDKQIETTGQLEVKDTLARFTTDVIGTVAFGIECNSLKDKNSKFYEMGTKVFNTPQNFFSRMLRNTFRDLSKRLHLKAVPKDISDFYLGITKETVEYREKNPQVNRQDFINLLMQMKKADAITVEQIAAQSFVFFLAGYETSSSTMTYAMFEFSVNEDIQEKARQNVKDAIKKHGGLTYDAVGDMHYLEQCVDETLRKYPVVSSLVRTPLSDYKVPDSDVTIPKDTQVMIPVSAIHWDEKIYPEPQKFDPDRFTPEEKAKRHQYSYLPFGEGPRICIGMRFGIVETKLGLARLLLKYKFSLDRSKTSNPLKISPTALVLSPTERIYLNIEKIKN